MSQRHVSDSLLVQSPEDGQVAVDCMSRLHSNHAGNVSSCHGILNLLGGGGKSHVVLVVGDQSFDHINLKPDGLRHRFSLVWSEK